MNEEEQAAFRQKYLAQGNVKGQCDAEGCVEPKVKGAGQRSCYWHKLSRQSADVQATAALARLADSDPSAPRTRPKSVWPKGQRWCGGCRSYVPLSYCSAATCKGCTINSRRRLAFGLEFEQQHKLSDISGGKCQGCGKAQVIKALAVDHDHYSGEVRGLLCIDCNTTVGNFHNDRMRFLRLAIYLTNPPATQIGVGKPMTRSEVVMEIVRMTEEICSERGLK